ncbi:MAG: hypothetical protein WDN45_07010 [Caulobacteraceae bacterium]
MGPADDIHVAPDGPGRAAIAAATRPLPVMPLVYNAANGQWFGQQIAAMLASAPRRRALIDRLETQLAALGARGSDVRFRRAAALCPGRLRLFSRRGPRALRPARLAGRRGGAPPPIRPGI